MIHTISGRIQTRIFLLGVVGGIWTVIITPLVRVVVDSQAMGSPDLVAVSQVTFSVLITVLLLGVLWEFVYHGLMQFRWEKDWPTLFGYVTIVNEGIVAYWFATSVAASTDAGAPEWRLLLSGLTLAPFLVAFVTTWIVVNLFANNMMKVFFIRWRFRGGRILGSWTP